MHEGSASAIRHIVLDAARQYVQNATIPPQQCLRVAAGTEGEGTGVEARLFDVTDGEELDRSHGQSAVHVHACAGPQPRSVRLEMRASAGKLDAILGERVARAK